MKTFFVMQNNSLLILNELGKCIGSIGWGVGFNDLRVKGSFAIGYEMNKEFRNKGIMSKALKIYCENTPQKSLHAVIQRDNYASQKLVIKCGFKLVDDSDYLVYEYSKPKEDRIAV